MSFVRVLVCIRLRQMFIFRLVMAHGEKFCLRWNDFENNISTAFRELRDDKDFFDVTIACGRILKDLLRYPRAREGVTAQVGMPS